MQQKRSDLWEQRKLSVKAKYLDVTLNFFTCKRKRVNESNWHMDAHLILFGNRLHTDKPIWTLWISIVFILERNRFYDSKTDCNVMYIIIALVKVKTSNYLSKKNEIWNKARGWKKIHNPYVSFDIVTFAIYGNNNNGNMVVGEIPQFFQFPKRDISTARCKCTIYIFRYKGIKVVIGTEFINMTVLLSM